MFLRQFARDDLGPGARSASSLGSLGEGLCVADPTPPPRTPPLAPTSPLPLPSHVQARQQLARERVIAGAELKVLHEQLKWCYHREGVNHYENCRELVALIAAKSRSPYYGMLGAPSREW